MSNKGGSTDDIKVPVRNFLLIKRLEDDPDRDGGLRLVGTFVQYVLNEEGLDSLNDGDGDDDTPCKYFAYRFNDCSYEDDNSLVFRRTQTTKDNIWRTTLQTKIPLKISIEKELFPFKVMTATAEIELSSGFHGDRTIRPNLVVARGEHLRSNVAIHETEITSGDVHGDVDASLDCMAKYDLLSPYPKITYRYEKKKEYCPKYSVTFHLRVDGKGKFVGTLLPLIFVSMLNTLYLARDYQNRDAENDLVENDRGLLEFSSTLGLTVVFLFGSIYEPVASKAKWPDIFYVILIFISLILSSISESFVGNFSVRIIGATLFWISFFIPITNGAKIWRLENQKRPRKGTEKSFVKDENYETRSDFADDAFITLEPDPENKTDLTKEVKRKLGASNYTLKEEWKNILISYNDL